MMKKRHSPEQIIRKLREAEGHLSAGMTIGRACQKLEISEQTLDNQILKEVVAGNL